LNITGPEIVSVRKTAERFGSLFGVEPAFTNQESGKALLANASLALRLFGNPRVSVDQMVHWIADWLLQEHPLLDKPTSFEVTDGKY
jgi:hypothetical protein